MVLFCCCHFEVLGQEKQASDMLSYLVLYISHITGVVIFDAHGSASRIFMLVGC
jgi:hypothetical protein